MQDKYDIVVVGGGPAGTTAAKWAAMAGTSVALFEKDREIGIPVRCAEATSLDDLKKYVEVDENWFATIIDRVRFVSPSGIPVEVNLPMKGVVLNRRIFDNDLAIQAASQGVEIYTKAYVHDIEFNSKDYLKIKVKHIGEEKVVKTKIVIAADGVESRMARFAGVRTQYALKDVESCVQILAGNIQLPPDRIDIYISERWAPGGYVWVFPKSSRSANIGLGVIGNKMKTESPLQLLNKFLKEIHPDVVPIATIAGGVPVACSLKTLARDGLLIVGDAARHTNPVSGGGILAALHSGKLAGEVAGKAIQKNDPTITTLKEYQKTWDKTVGKEYRRFYRIKEWIQTLPDEYYDEMANLLTNLKPDEITLTKIFKLAVKNKPSLLLDVIKVFAGY
jgi:digeranylgeranylglycerophospholipid reductase